MKMSNRNRKPGNFLLLVHLYYLRLLGRITDILLIFLLNFIDINMNSAPFWQLYKHNICAYVCVSVYSYRRYAILLL